MSQQHPSAKESPRITRPLGSMAEQKTAQQPSYLRRKLTRASEKIGEGKQRWELFLEDYDYGGGIKYGLYRAFHDGFFGAVLTGSGGGGLGIAIPLFADALNENAATPTAMHNPTLNSEIGTPLEWIPALPIALAIGGGAIGGVIFFIEGLLAPARIGERSRRPYDYQDYFF